METKRKKIFLSYFLAGAFLVVGLFLTYGTQNVYAATAPCGPNEFCNPLSFNTVDGFLTTVLSALQKIIVLLALVFIVIGAVMYVTAGANPDNAENGKKAIMGALIGLALGIGAPSFLKEIGGIIGWNGANSAAVAGAASLSTIAMNVLNFLLGILGILALVMMVLGGIMYLTSAGDEDRIDKGKEMFKYSLIGVIIAMSAMILVRQIATFFASSSSATTSTTQTTTATQSTQTNACESGETCTNMLSDGNGGWTSPDGKTCYWRNVCPNDPMQACCK